MSGFIIEVYRLRVDPGDRRLIYLNRYIPIGTTITKFDRDPEFIWKCQLKHGAVLKLDQPTEVVYVTYRLKPYLKNKS